MAIADRPDLLEFFENLLEGLKPREISKRLNVDVKRVYALRKTFDRRTDEIQRELFGRQPSEDTVGRDAERVKI
jgi:transposase